MLSTRLIQMIESHADELARCHVQQLRTHPRTPTYRKLSDTAIYDRTYAVYRNLSAWMGGRPGPEMEQHYKDLGRRRYEEGIPLHEFVYALVLNKKNLLIFAKNQARSGSAVEIYSEQELVNRVDQFYDDAIYYAVVGYQAAIARPPATVAAAARR
jgi:hypothetical protein